jgi:hypothetical protein
MGKKRSTFLAMVHVSLVAVCWWAAGVNLQAQTVNGTILGIVQDQQGAVIARADVSARNLETGSVRKAVSDGNGNFRISSVPAGSYEVSAATSGF